MTNDKLKNTQIASLGLMFFLMCGLRMWFAIFLYFIFGITLTIITKKRTYCANFCPLGALSDAFSSKENKKFLKLPKSIQYLTFIVFFLYIFFILYYNWGNTFLLWAELFKFILFIVFIALTLQVFYKNRTWCTTLCPMGKIYKGIIKYKI